MPQPDSENVTRCVLLSPDLVSLAKKTAVVAVVGGLSILAVWGIIAASDVLLLAFGGVLLAIFLRALTSFAQHYTKLGEYWALALVVALVAIFLLASFWLLIPPLVAQSIALSEELPAAWESLRERLSEQAWARFVLEEIPEDAESLLPDKRLLLYRTPGIAAWALGGIGILLVVFFVAILSAVQPRYYKRGMIALVSVPQRPRAEEVLDKIHHALKWWLIAKVIAMFIVGLLSWLGLMLLGVPLAATLAIIAAVLTFVPNFGPIISAIPAVLIALSQDLQTAAWVIVLYTSIQLLESYAITPRLQYYAISMPPAVLITAQLVLWTWAGVLGLIFATPLTAVALVLIRTLYIRDMLGDDQFKNE